MKGLGKDKTVSVDKPWPLVKFLAHLYKTFIYNNLSSMLTVVFLCSKF